MLIGGVLASLRYVPGLLWKFAQRRMMTTLYVRDNLLVSWICDWMDSNSEVLRSRWLQGAVLETADGPQAYLGPGEGLHLFNSSGKRFWLWSELEENGLAGKIQTITLRCFGRNSEPLRKLIAQVGLFAAERKHGKNVTYLNDKWGGWQLIKIGSLRSVETVILKDRQRDEIIKDTRWFFSAKEWYLKRGLPYRRGYLFYGPPGNGKSSMIQAIATQFSLRIYMLCLSAPELTDSALAVAMGKLPAKSILVLEDADRINYDLAGVTISGLLNSIDGALASEGRILILTANDPAKLDEALMRPGRLDCVWEFERPDADMISRMAKRFFDDAPDSDIRSFTEKAVRGSVSMAELQNHFMVVGLDIGEVAQVAKNPVETIRTNGRTRIAIDQNVELPHRAEEREGNGSR